jgi:alanyl-tRNA synthetase
MTHVLNFALKSVLIGDDSEKAQGGMCDQKGSLVDAEKLRFDFAWNGPVSPEALGRVEAIVQAQIASSLTVFSEVVPLASSSKISALRAVFGEKYPDPVRVISVGTNIQQLLDDPSNPKWATSTSVEFCGGTHLSNTNEAEAFALIEESGIQKGVRRIVGLTRQAALSARATAAEFMRRVTDLEALEAGPVLSFGTKIIKLELDQAVISVVDKENIRQRVAGLTEKLKVWFKANLATRVAEATVVCEKVTADALAANKSVVCMQVDFGGDGKLAKKIQEAARKVHVNGSFMILSIDEEADKSVFPFFSSISVFA